jgi:hypothetical protein
VKTIRLLILMTYSLGICLAASAQEAAQEAVSGSGGTLSAPTSVGPSIVVTGVQLSNGQTATLSCPVTFFGASTYEWKWSCAKGTLRINGASVATVKGAMTLTCSGGGRLRAVTCWHFFTGAAVDSDLDIGSVLIAARGGSGTALGAVRSFTASW